MKNISYKTQFYTEGSDSNISNFWKSTQHRR